MLVPLMLLLSGAPAAKMPVPPPIPSVAVPPVIECPDQGTKPAGCTEPPLRDFIAIYGAWNPKSANEQAAAGLVRLPVVLWRGNDAIPTTGFPAALRRGELETSGEAELLVTIGPDDAVASCTLVATRGREGLRPDPAAPEIKLDPAVGAAACQVVSVNRKYRHALDRSGQLVAAPLRLNVQFVRKRHSNYPAPPPPSPPSRWIGEGPYHANPAWAPRWAQSYAANQVFFSAPRWKDFLGQRKDFLESAAVGVLMDFDRAGTVGGCRIGNSSGDAALDLATCQALTSVRNQAQGGWGARNYPILVHWQKNKARMVLPVFSVPPALSAPLQIAETEVPAGPAPKYSTRLWVQLGADGKMRSCRIDHPADNPDAFDAAACQLVAGRARFTGGRDLFGAETVSGLNLTVDWAKRTITMNPNYF